MITFADVLTKLKQGKSVWLKFNLNFGIYSRHKLRLQKGMIVDHSYVDQSIERSSIAAYMTGFYGEAFSKNAVQLIQEKNNESKSDP
jgi:hypothetical protein